MPDPQARELPPPPDGDTLRLINPSSSRMLANYLADIEQLLEEHRWEQALGEAADLPQLAAALADPELQVSAAGIEQWCAQWLVPPATELNPANTAGAIEERLSGSLGSSSVPERTVPALALRRLRLHRLARTRPRGFQARPLTVPDDTAADAVQFCTALTESTRRWYAQCACHDATVQANLARLAVLR